MKRLLLAAAMAAIAIVPARGGDVGVSVNVGQPGFYGRVEMGNLSQPRLIYPEPVVIEPAPVNVERQPIYLHVRPHEAKEWGKYCRKYNACGQSVYFVQETWYNNVY